MTSSSVIDRAAFSELQNSAGADFVIELVDAFTEEAPQLLAELRRALAADDAVSFRRAAHSLKSNGLTFGATAFAELARELELGKASALGAPALDRLEALFAEASAALRELSNG
jgi:HPt (histidine-containing phosphotransfer) domain-containing protein